MPSVPPGVVRSYYVTRRDQASGERLVVGRCPVGSVNRVGERTASAYRLITTASPRSGERPRRATTSSLFSTLMRGGTVGSVSHFGVVRSDVSRSSGGRHSVGSNSGSRNSRRCQYAALRVFGKLNDLDLSRNGDFSEPV